MLILLILLLSIQSQACIEKFLTLSQHMQNEMPGFEKHKLVTLNDASFSIISNQKTDEGVIYRLRELPDQHWHQSKSLREPQGSNLWFIELLGRKGSSYFGVELITNGDLLFPNTSELISRYQRFQGHYIRPLPMNFYPSNSQNLVQYLERFANLSAIPINDSDQLYFHDTNFHFLTALISDADFILTLRSYTHLLIDYYKFLQKNFPNQYNSQQMKHFKYEVVKDLDLITGGIANRINNSKAYPETAKNMVLRFIHNFYNSQKYKASAKDFLSIRDPSLDPRSLSQYLKQTKIEVFSMQNPKKITDRIWINFVHLKAYFNNNSLL